MRSRVRRNWEAARRRWVRLGLPIAVPVIRRTVPHDPQAFTQGLLHAGGMLYESTGLVGRSSLRCLDPQDGSVRRLVPVTGDHAEGIAVDGSRLYQLSWHSGIARIYRFPELEPIGSVRYEGEGWGLASSPAGFLMSDGSSTLQIRGRDFQMVGQLPVRSNGMTVPRLNDLVWARERIYANVWGATDVLEIDPDTGRVCRVIDCRELVRLAAPTQEDAVLNGIAFSETSGAFYLTGKLWPLLFEADISPPGP